MARTAPPGAAQQRSVVATPNGPGVRLDHDLSLLPDAVEPEVPLRIRLARPSMGEEELDAVRQVLLSDVLIDGPWTKEFEDRFAERHEVPHAVALANGTEALAAIYLALGIGAGDEVIVPSMTFISSAASVCHVGATPVFADVDAETFTLDPADVSRRITGRTRAILAVHYGGQAADMDELLAVADEAGVVLVEDAAQAHGASYRGRPVGGLGRAGIFSFTPTKNMTTGQGGMVTTHDGELADRIRLLRNHGRTGPYRHEIVGFNWRMTEMQAALGVVQLAKLDGALQRKRDNAEWMRARLQGLAGVTPPVRKPDRDHVYMLYTVLLETGRDDVLADMLAAGVEARIYFPPVHDQPVFSDAHADLPVTSDVSRRMISLPFHAGLDRWELDEVATTFEAAVSRARGADRLPPRR